MKYFSVLIGFLLCSFVVTAQVHFKKTANGLEYKFLKENKGERIKEDDIVFMNLSYMNSKDSVLFNSWKMGGEISIQVKKQEYKGDFYEALMLLTTGDSAIFKLNADSFFSKTFGQTLPTFIEPGSFLTFTVKVNKVSTKDKLEAEQKAEEEKMKTIETAAIAKYISDSQLKAFATESGLQYVITVATANNRAVTGKKVKVHYTGYLLDGTKFDSSVDRGEPFEFTLGVGQVIKGWDEGIALLRKGEKAKLIIPSSIGYSARGAGGVIKPYSPLVFDVELIDFN